MLLRDYLPGPIQALIPALRPTETTEETVTEAAPTEAAATETPEPAATETDAPVVPAPTATLPAASPTPEILPTATHTALPEPTATAAPEKIPLAFADDFCNIRQTNKFWTLSEDPGIEFGATEDKECQLSFTANNERRSSLLLNQPIEIKDGAEIEFTVQLDPSSPQDLMILRWYPGEDDPVDLSNLGSIDVEIGSGKIRTRVLTGAEGQDASVSQNLDDAGAHQYKIKIEDGLKLQLEKDGEELAAFDEPLFVQDSIGRLIFIGKGQLRSVEITVP